MKIILASGSPRRSELLRQIGISFQIQPAVGEEKITKQDPASVVEELSQMKALEVADTVSLVGNHEYKQSWHNEDVMVIGADTVVAYQGKIMGKPCSCEDAYRMLSLLSGNTHSVYTGVTAVIIQNGSKTVQTFSEETKVAFYQLTHEEITEYISSKEPMDKAGSYGIQGLGAKFIRKIEGDYNNVVGFPLAHFYQEIWKDKRIMRV